MKKVISLLLALAMVMGLSVTAFAAEGDANNVGTGAYSTSVTGSYVAGTAASGTVFSVDIGWSGLSFTYYAEKAPVWDAVNHKYSDSTPAKWEGEGTITVTNHSNAKISATPTYNKGTGYENVNMTFSTAKLLVDSAESGSAQTGTITITPTGALPANTQAQTIGTITIAIAHNPDYTKAEMQALVEASDVLKDQVRMKYMDTSMPSEVYTAQSKFETALTECEYDLEYGFYDDQNNLNSDYVWLLSAYNALKTAAGL